MKRVLLSLVVLLAIQAWPMLAQAQDSPALSSLEVSLWPEYDRAEVLVIYNGTFAPETRLPVPVEMRIPARVGSPTAVAYRSDDRLLTQEYVTREDGDWLVVAFELRTLEFQLEYYDDQLSLQAGGGREFNYSYRADHPVADLRLVAQVPPDAESFALNPAADSVSEGDYGLQYHTAEVGPVQRGQELAWTLSYEKTSPTLTEELLFPPASRSQDPLSLSSLEISLWPEFDRSEVLVIYEGYFAPETPLPVPVEIRIPARATQPHAVAYVSEGRLLEQQYSIQHDGEWLVVAFELPVLGYYLEYYDDQLSMQAGGSREFTFSYQPDYPVAELTFKAQVPPDASSFALQPAADSVSAGDYGLDYHNADLGAVEKGLELTWSLSYKRTSSVFTEDILFPDPTPVQPVPAEEDGNSTLLIFLIGFLATIGVGAGAFWLGRRTLALPEPVPAKRPKRRGSGRGRSTDSPEIQSSDVRALGFCFRCGAELREDSDFCHHCGAETRR